MTDYLETSGNRQRRFLTGLRHVNQALFELYTVKSTRGLELPVILSTH